MAQLSNVKLVRIEIPNVKLVRIEIPNLTTYQSGDNPGIFSWSDH